MVDIHDTLAPAKRYDKSARLSAVRQFEPERQKKIRIWHVKKSKLEAKVNKFLLDIQQGLC